MVIFIFLGLVVTFVVPYFIYYFWMKRKMNENWNLEINRNYQPKVSLIIPTYNEARVITKKLENVQKLDYPKDKLQVIIVDSASTDGTLETCKRFLETKTSCFPVILLSEKERMGKSHALNTALESAEGEIIATSDADSFWEFDVLQKVVPFFADSRVGAITGREELINLEKSIHTMSEGLYRKFYYTLRLGESKVHSTLIFQGELSFYRKSALERFEDKPGYSDDTGSMIKIVSRGYRGIFIPEAVFYDTAAYSLCGRLMLKSRRAQHLISAITEAFTMKIKRRLPLPLSIVLFNFYMHVISPLLLVCTVLIAVVYLEIFWPLFLIVLPFLIFKRSRIFIVSYLTSCLALIIGLIRHLLGKRELAWHKIEEMRAQ